MRVSLDSPLAIQIADIDERKGMTPQSDTAGYTVLIPSLAADVPLANEWRETTLVNHVRKALAWGRFPGWEQYEKRPTKRLAALTVDLEPIQAGGCLVIRLPLPRMFLGRVVRNRRTKSMKCLHRFAMVVPLAAAMLFAQAPAQDPAGQSKDKEKEATQATPPAQSETSRTAGQADAASSKTVTGTIVDASCNQASALTAAGGTNSKAKSDVLKHCQPTASTKSYALLTDDGNFLTLDDTGNSQVATQFSEKKKNMKASVTGTVEGNTLKVQSLTKM
jgi:hypothetical protein